MNFPIQGKKATQAVARLIEKSGGPVDYLRLSKLVYLADRESIQTRGIPIVGGHYFSMNKGPTIGEIMTFVGSRNAPGWKSTISPRFGNEIRLQGKPTNETLSESEKAILDATVQKHGMRTTNELVEWCHKNCPEYEEVPVRVRKTITVESILKAAGKSQKKIKALVQEAEALTKLDEMLA